MFSRISFAASHTSSGIATAKNTLACTTVYQFIVLSPRLFSRCAWHCTWYYNRRIKNIRWWLSKPLTAFWKLTTSQIFRTSTLQRKIVPSKIVKLCKQDKPTHLFNSSSGFGSAKSVINPNTHSRTFLIVLGSLQECGCSELIVIVEISRFYAISNFSKPHNFVIGVGMICSVVRTGFQIPSSTRPISFKMFTKQHLRILKILSVNIQTILKNELNLW